MINPYDIYHRLEQLKELRKDAPIDEFLWAFDEFMRIYTEGDGKFDPDAYFPNKQKLKWLVNEIQANNRTIELLTRNTKVRDNIDTNIVNIDGLADYIKNLDWVKRPDTYVIDASRISDWDRINLKKKLQDCKLIFKEEESDDET